MKKILSKFASTLVVFSFVVSGSGALPLIVSAEPAEKISICHATSSSSNPYVSQSPNIENNGDLSGGHLNHTGGVYPTDNWGDIIPPYSNGDFNYPGMNWTAEGQAIYNNDCMVEGEEEGPQDGVVHILKYIDGEMATEVNADGASFPMITPTFDNAPFTLDADGWTTGDDPYEASTSTMDGGSTYSAYENTDTDLVGDSCRENKPYALLGYTTGSSIEDAEENDPSDETPEVTVDGDMYIIVWNEKCEDEEEPRDVTVTIVKYLDDGDDETPLVAATAANTGDESFAMTATWDAENIGSGSGDFTLGPVGFNNPTAYNATTSEMTDGADYSVVENIESTCTANNDGEYVLVGYKIGNTLNAALNATLTSSASLTNITTDKFIIVVNEECDNDTSEGDDGADLEITKTVDDTTVRRNQNVTYTLTVTNHGPDTATNVQVNDDLPDGVSFISSDASQGSYDEDTGIWNIGTLLDDETVTLEIEVNVDISSGRITNTANVFLNDTEDIDDNTSNDSDSVDIRARSSGGGGGSSSSSSSRNNDDDDDDSGGQVLGAQTSNTDENPLEGRVLGAHVGLPYTGTSSSTSIYVLLISLTIFIYTSAQIIRRKIN